MKEKVPVAVATSSSGSVARIAGSIVETVLHVPMAITIWKNAQAALLELASSNESSPQLIVIRAEATRCKDR